MVFEIKRLMDDKDHSYGKFHYFGYLFTEVTKLFGGKKWKLIKDERGILDTSIHDSLNKTAHKYRMSKTFKEFADNYFHENETYPTTEIEYFEVRQQHNIKTTIGEN